MSPSSVVVGVRGVRCDLSVRWRRISGNDIVDLRGDLSISPTNARLVTGLAVKLAGKRLEAIRSTRDWHRIRTPWRNGGSFCWPNFIHLLFTNSGRHNK